MIGNIIVRYIVCTSLNEEAKKKKPEIKRQKLGMLRKPLLFIDYKSSMIDGEQIGIH